MSTRKAMITKLLSATRMNSKVTTSNLATLETLLSDSGEYNSKTVVVFNAPVVCLLQHTGEW